MYQLVVDGFNHSIVETNFLDSSLVAVDIDIVAKCKRLCKKDRHAARQIGKRILDCQRNSKAKHAEHGDQRPGG